MKKEEHFNDRQKKIMRALGLKDTTKMTRLVIKLHKNTCEECKIILQTSLHEPLCKECLIKNKETINEILQLKRKLRGL